MTITLALALTLVPQATPAELPQSFIRPPVGMSAGRFGRHFEVDGDLALVGHEAPFASGGERSIWTYARQAGDWTLVDVMDESELGGAPSGTAVQTFFLEGTRLVVSHPGREFEWTGNTWVQVGEIVSGTVLAVDFASDRAIATLNNWNAEIWERDASGWSMVAEFFPSTGGGGFQAALEGDVAVLGMPFRFTCDHFANPGQIMILERGAAGPWSVVSTIEDEGSCSGQQSMFGLRVGVSGGQVLAVDQESTTGPSPLVRVFEEGGSGWNEVDRIEPAAGPLSAATPSSIGPWVLEGDYLLTLPHPPATQRNLFHRTPNGWEFLEDFTVANWPATQTNQWGSAVFDPPLDLFFVDAPSTTGLAPRVGVALLGHPLSHQEIAIFEPVVSAETCPGVPNSTGSAATLRTPGSDVLADGRLSLVGASLPANALTLPLVSSSFGFIAHPGNSAGNLCLGAPGTRLLSLAGSAGVDGSFQVHLDLAGLPSSPIQPGDRLFFQLWYRDAGGTNFSSGAAVQMN